MDSNSYIRIGHSLCEGEREYIAKRKTIVQQWLQRNDIKCTEEEVPIIALLGSGGGERAMVGLLGSLYQMGRDQTDLLDSISYLSGTSGSTWCMASLYEQTNWSSKLESVKQQMVGRLKNDGVSFLRRGLQLISYYRSRDHFSLTHVWAAMVVPQVVKAINDRGLSGLQCGHEEDPYPIYTAIDQDSKHASLAKDAWFELTPHEAGYSVTGAFVETSRFGSGFDRGTLVKEQPEIDMLYLQGLCSSALAESEEILKAILKWIKALVHKMMMEVNPGLKVLHSLVTLNLHESSEADWSSAVDVLNELLEGKKHLNGRDMKIDKLLWKESGAKILERSAKYTLEVCEMFFHWFKDLETDPWVVVVKSLEKVLEKKRDVSLYSAGPTAAHDKEEVLKAIIDQMEIEPSRAESRVAHLGHRLLHLIVEMNLQIVKEEDWTISLRELNTLLKGKKNVIGLDMTIDERQWRELAARDREQHALRHTLDVCQSFFHWFGDLEKESFRGIVNALMKFLSRFFWIWGTTNNFLYNMQAPDVDPSILGDSLRYFEDAAIMNNSPFQSVTRPERNVDLIVSLDFSSGNPMETVVAAAKACKEMDIPFPVVDVSGEDSTAPKDFYVFNGHGKAPTVIHMPLFNVVNCADHTVPWWREKYCTFQLDYSPEMIDELSEKAGENITNNKHLLLKEIEEIIRQKREAIAASTQQ